MWTQRSCVGSGRTEELAKQSEIKSQAYSPGSIRELFEGMRAQVERLLLFLKSVRSAAVFIREAGDAAPHLLFQATVDTQVSILAYTMPLQQALQHVLAHPPFGRPSTLTLSGTSSTL